jgi:hypothetical protein
MASKNLSAPTAADVRAFLTADEKRLARVPLHARKSLTGSTDKGPRGQIHPDAIKVYNRGRKPERQYVTGVGVKAKAQAEATRAAYVKAGGGERGPMKAAILAKVTKG